MAEQSQFGNVRLVMGLSQLGWVLEPGETFTTPEAALVCSPAGLGQMSRQLHRAIRERLVRDPCHRERRPVLINNWEATYFDFNKEKELDIAREAAPLGIELLVMDDGWFGVRDSDNSGLGGLDRQPAKTLRRIGIPSVGSTKAGNEIRYLGRAGNGQRGQ